MLTFRVLPFGESGKQTGAETSNCRTSENHACCSQRGAIRICVEVLRPSQPNGVMSSAVSLPNHTFTGQA